MVKEISAYEKRKHWEVVSLPSVPIDTKKIKQFEPSGERDFPAVC